MSDSAWHILTFLCSLISLGFAGSMAYIYYQDRIRRDIFWKNQTVSHGQLEEMYGSLYEAINGLSRSLKEQENFLKITRTAVGFGVVKTGLHRYNSAADEVGGNLSFSLALLDEHESGVVITSLHGRSSSRVYCKQVERGDSPVVMTDEEKQAVKTAQAQWRGNISLLNIK